MAVHDDRHGCAEHGAVTRRALARRVGEETIALPERLLDEGARRFSERPASRRTVLAGAAGLALAISGLRLGRGDGLGTLLQLAGEAEAAGPAPILVTIFLNGGVDGLDTLIPISGPDADVYRAQRTRIGRRSDAALAELIPLGGAAARTDLAWHPSAAPLRALYDAGKIAVLPAVDYPSPDLSHFHSAHFWRTGTTDFSVQTGWLGRFLDTHGGTNPLQGVAVRSGTDDTLRTRTAPTSALLAARDFKFFVPGVWTGIDPVTPIDAMRRLAAPAKTAALARASAVTRESHEMWSSLEPLRAGAAPPSPTAAGYPSDIGLSARLADTARLLAAGLGVRVATLEADGSWDTHAEQPITQRERLSAMTGAVAAFQADLEARGIADRVLTLVWSEFGRRVEDNQSRGTDHGAGGIALAIGTTVRAGLLHDPRRTDAPGWNLGAHAAWNGNVPVGIDFRDLYAGVLAGHLGVEPGSVLGGYAGTPLLVTA